MMLEEYFRKREAECEGSVCQGGDHDEEVDWRNRGITIAGFPAMTLSSIMDSVLH